MTNPPPVQPWHEAAAREIQRVAYPHADGMSESILRGEVIGFAEIMAKHDPANTPTPAPTSGRDHTQTEGTQ